jgi:hypothetical protein
MSDFPLDDEPVVTDKPPLPKAAPMRKTAPTPKREAAPKNININLPGSAGPKPGRPGSAARDAKIVQERSEQVLQITAGIVAAFLHQTEDAQDMVAGSTEWAKAMGGLAEHEKWLVDLCKTGPSGRVSAWVAVVIATGGIALPILVRHGAFPDRVGEILTQAMGMSSVLVEQ